jgi:hypothetical protein
MIFSGKISPLLRSPIMKRILTHGTVLLAFGAVLLGQSAKLPSTLHIKGSMTQCGKKTPHFWVAFRGDTTKTVRADDAGAYEVDLPPGSWTAITVAVATETADGASLSRPRHFRVTAPGSLMLNLNLRPPVMCDLAIITPNGQPATPERTSGRDQACWGEKSFQVPSADGVPFEVDLFGLDSGWNNGWDPCSTNHENKMPHREFATYNLLSVEANKIAYDENRRSLEARGDVVIEDESGEHKAQAITFYIQNGRAFTVQTDR